MYLYYSAKFYPMFHPEHCVVLTVDGEMFRCNAAVAVPDHHLITGGHRPVWLALGRTKQIYNLYKVHTEERKNKI